MESRQERIGSKLNIRFATCSDDSVRLIIGLACECGWRVISVTRKQQGTRPCLFAENALCIVQKDVSNPAYCIGMLDIGMLDGHQISIRCNIHREVGSPFRSFRSFRAALLITPCSIPKSSVIDKHHWANDVPNLFVVDGSSFVTSLPNQPTCTIQPLA